MARENIAILSRTLRLYTSSVLPETVLLVAVVGKFLELSESVSDSVLPDDSAEAECDDFIAVGSPPSSSLYGRSGLQSVVRSEVASHSVNIKRKMSLKIRLHFWSFPTLSGAFVLRFLTNLSKSIRFHVF